MSIRKFFTVKPEGISTPKRGSYDKDQLFKPFLLKQGMKLAPVFRTRPFTKDTMEHFDAQIDIHQDSDIKKVLYLEELRSGLHRPRSDKHTVFSEPDIVLLSNEELAEPVIARKLYRKKLLQFHENRRPSKYGFWMRRSKTISGRKPFAKDENIFDYDVDSDDEWEDEAEGDDCKSDDEDEDIDGDTELDDEDKAFFVDHGYLSTSENASDEEEGMDPECRRERNKAKMLTFEAAMESRKKRQLRLLAWAPVRQGQSNESWSGMLVDFITVILPSIRPIPTSFTPGILPSTPLRSFNSRTPKSEKKVTLKRKIQDKRDDDQLKRGVVSLP